MAFWNFSHNILHMHVWMLPTILLVVVMIAAGLIHSRKEKKRKEEYNKELRGEIPGTPDRINEEVKV